MSVRRETSGEPKKEWRRPELVVYGTVEAITRTPKGCPGPDALGLGDPMGRSGPCG